MYDYEKSVIFNMKLDVEMLLVRPKTAIMK